MNDIFDEKKEQSNRNHKKGLIVESLLVPIAKINCFDLGNKKKPENTQRGGCGKGRRE